MPLLSRVPVLISGIRIDLCQAHATRGSEGDLSYSQGRVLIALENTFFSLLDENMRPTTPLSRVNTL